MNYALSFRPRRILKEAKMKQQEKLIESETQQKWYSMPHGQNTFVGGSIKLLAWSANRLFDVKVQRKVSRKGVLVKKARVACGGMTGVLYIWQA